LDRIPRTLFLPDDLKYYSVKSVVAISIMRKFANEFEYIGIDERFIDATECINLFPKAKN